MPGKPDKPHRIRVRVRDGKPRERNKLKGLLVPHVDVVDALGRVEFIVCAMKEAHLDQVRAKLAAAGLEEVAGGDTTVTITSPPGPTSAQQRPQGGSRDQRGDQPSRGSPQRNQARPAPRQANAAPLPGKPYGFVALPDEFKSAAPVWHDGTSSAGRLSGEIRFELETLTSLLVGWERGQVGNTDSDWPIPSALPSVGQLPAQKSVLCPLRAPWGKRPVIIPGDSLKGLLRHELGALLGAPMERVAERSYSYRPNQRFPYDQRDPQYRPGTARLEPRLARVRTSRTIDIDGKAWPVPGQVDVLSMAMRDQQAYFPRREGSGRTAVIIRPPNGAERYRGGLGGGEPLPEQILAEDARRRIIHTHIDVSQLRVQHEAVSPSDHVIDQYAATLAHLLNVSEGHFSARHPHIGTDQQKQRTAQEAVAAGAARAFQPGDIIWVEWDTEKERIVSFGWHYYYRWAYTDSVRRNDVRKDGGSERAGLFPLKEEREQDADGAPTKLSLVRRLFGYTGDNEGSAGIGKDDHAQLMGRISVNAALEVVTGDDTDEKRFLPPTFLKELGMPRPSAVEHYLKQRYHPTSRPSDRATLETYGDAAGYDAPGELAGRKFYLDRRDAYSSEPWKDDSPANRANDRSTLALEASRPGRRFRFTVRFRDLDAAEVAAIMIAMCPNQFSQLLEGAHADGYCSKLGYARPLGWGSVRVETKALLWLDSAGGVPVLEAETDVVGWVKRNYQPTATQAEWLSVHRCKHPDAADYPRENGKIFTFHTRRRAEHARARRYRREQER